jgi:hypothetical protein
LKDSAKKYKAAQFMPYDRKKNPCFRSYKEYKRELERIQQSIDRTPNHKPKPLTQRPRSSSQAVNVSEFVI